MATPDEARKTFLAAVTRGDVDTIVALYHPDAVLEAPEGRFEGREGIASYYRAQLSPFDAALNVVAAYDTGDVGITEWVMEATHARALELPDGNMAPATGRHVRQRGVDVGIYANGLINTHRVYYDQIEALEQLGLLPGGEE
jgi:ketosteroid isomerase-like protein